MRRFFIFLVLLLAGQYGAQVFSGEVYLRDNSSLYLNQVFVTNLNLRKTVLVSYDGSFTIPAQAGDVIRFTSIVTDRKDITLKPQDFTKKVLIELRVAYREIQEVVINKFKPTGIFRKDIAQLSVKDKGYEVEKALGLPRPKGNGLPPDVPVLGFGNGGLNFSIDAFYDLVSGEKKKRERLQKYERMAAVIKNIKNYVGQEYFKKINIPESMVDNFLQFVYTSENIDFFAEKNNYEAIVAAMDKYIPIYQKRLRNSYLQETVK